MAKVSSKSIEQLGHHILIYGPPKTGKTKLAGLLAAEFDLLWFDLEHGSMTLFQLPRGYQDRIELISVPDNRKNYQAITTMLHVTDGTPIKVCDMHGKVNNCSVCSLAKATSRTDEIGTMIDINPEALGPNVVVVVDSLTQLSHSAMGKTFGGIKDDAPVKPEYANYTGQGFYLDRFLTSVQNSKANWVVISHEESLEQEDGKEKIVPMGGTRNFAKNVARYFDHVVYTKVENYKHVASSAATDDMKVLTGSRTNVSLKNNPDALAIISLLKTVKTVDPSPSSAIAGVSPSGGSALDKIRAKQAAK